MKKLIAIVILLSGAAFSQGVRYDLPPILSARGTPIPNVIVTVCTAAATGVPCSPAATTYTDGTLGTACSAGTQVTLTGTNTCQGTSDALGNAGFWLSPGVYTYTLSGPGVTGKIYNLTVPVGSDASGNINIPGSVSVGGALGAGATNGILNAASPRYAGADIGAKVNAAQASADCPS